MSDFLKNLKNKDWQKNDQRGPGRQVYRDHIYKGGIGYDRRSERDRRAPHHKKPQENVATILGNFLPEIQTMLSQILESQKSQAEFFERITIAEEGLKHSLDNIAQALCTLANIEYNSIERPVNVPPAPTPKAPVQESSYEESDDSPEYITKYDDGNPSNISKDDVLRTIVEMRNDGATFDMIAMHLENENIPTFSNRGKWHAQTIHRLYTQNKDAF